MFGNTHPQYALSLNNIGIALSNTGRYEEALKYLQGCLVIREKILEKTHPDYAASLNNIGSVLIRIGRY